MRPLEEYDSPVPLTTAREASPRPACDDGTPRELGRVMALAVRHDQSRVPRAVPTARAVAGVGLDGDRHGDALSPRQVLLAGMPTYGRHGLAPHTLRENLLLDVDTAGLSSGTLLQVGPTAILWLTFHCEACGYLDARQPGLARAIGRNRGMLARVLHGGDICAGDRVVRLDTARPCWSDDWRDRVAQVLAQVPAGMVVEYRQLARLAGIQAVYCRALPALARKLGLSDRAAAQQAVPDRPRWRGDSVFDAEVVVG